MESKSCYKIATVACKDDVSPTPLWRPIDESSLTAYMQIGTDFGTLIMDFKSPCGCRFHREWFFCTTDTDQIFSKCMRPVTVGSSVEIHLPNGDRGRFSVHLKASGFDDAYILREVAHVNWMHDEYSLHLLFRTLRARILCRTAFRKLYFRCFRRSFAPTGRQGLLQCQMWEEGL